MSFNKATIAILTKATTKWITVDCRPITIDEDPECEIVVKVTTDGADSARNVMAAARMVRCEHLPCVVHNIRRAVRTALRDRFVNALAKCKNMVGHFKRGPANTAEHSNIHK